MPRAKRSVAKRSVALSDGKEPLYEGLDQFDILMEESENFCEGVGLHKDLIRQIIKTDTDWAFILKVDALLESASRHIIRAGLRIKVLNLVMHTARSEGNFRHTRSHPVNFDDLHGRTSSRTLLRWRTCRVALSCFTFLSSSSVAAII
jgi:hypothetical protein